MRLNISKLIISKLVILVLLILTGLITGTKVIEAQSYVYFEGDVGSVVAFQSPSAEGCVYIEGTNSPYNEPLWIKWTDQNGNGNTRYTLKPRGNNCYSFPSWQGIGEDGRNRDFFTYIKPDQPNEQAIEDIIQAHPGEYYFERKYVRKANTGNNDNFGCSENSHVITAVLPQGTPGSFTSGVAGNIDVNNDLITQRFPDIYYRSPTNKPINLTATCPAPGTTANLSWQPPDNTSGYTYDVRVDGTQPASFTRRDCAPHQVCVNNYGSQNMSISTTSSANYNFWVHACRFGSCSDAEYNNFSCGQCPQPPSSQTPTNGETLACTATGVDLSWTGPAGSLYNLRVDGEGARPASGTANNCSPHTICINGYKEEKIKINIQSGKSYTWWVDIQAPNACGYLTTGTKTFTTASCSPPRLGVLNISADTSDSPAGVAAGTYGISGLRSDDSAGTGSNYYNSLKITQKVTPGTKVSDIALVGMAFTDINNPPQNSLSSLISSVNSVNGFLLVYANKQTTIDGKQFDQGKYYLYYPRIRDNVNEGWSPDTIVGAALNYTDKGIYVAPLRPQPDNPRENPTFRVRLYSQFGSRTWGTYGYLLHTTNGVQTQSVISENPTLP